MKCNLNELITALEQIRDAPVHPAAGIELGRQLVFFKFFPPTGSFYMRQDFELKDQGQFLTIEVKV